MNTNEAYKLLKDNGFSYVRDAKHGEIWTNGAATVMLAHTPSDGAHGERNFRAEIKRAVRKKDELTKKEEPPMTTQPHVQVKLPEVQPNPFVAQEPKKGPMQLPDIIIAILVDGSLTDSQKIKMIFAYTEL